jgi:hypothetical protein
VGALTRIAVAAVVAAVGAVVAVLLIGRDAPLKGVEPLRALTVHASFDPPAVQFGDRVDARVVVLANRSALDTSGLRVTQNLGPLAALGAAQVSRTTRGDLLVVSYDQPAVCLSAGCLTRTGSKKLQLPAASATAPRQGGGVAHATSAPRVLTVGSRVTAADLAPSRPPFRADTSVPAVTWRIAPGTLELLLEILAVVLAVAAVGLAAWQATVVHAARSTAAQRTALERALAFVRDAESRPPADRRRAVGLLARVLRRRDEHLAGAADDLAWSEPAPAPDDLAELVDRVGRVDGVGREVDGT